MSRRPGGRRDSGCFRCLRGAAAATAGAPVVSAASLGGGGRVRGGEAVLTVAATGHPNNCLPTHGFVAMVMAATSPPLIVCLLPMSLLKSLRVKHAGRLRHGRR